MKQPELWIPAERFLAVVEPFTYHGYTKGDTTPRTICRLRGGEQLFISLTAADKILVELGLEHAWHLPQEAGGLADIYEDGVQYGHPNSRRPHAYPSVSLRLEARRASWRRTKAKARLAA